MAETVSTALWLAPLLSLLALAYGAARSWGVLRADAGAPRMQEVSKAIYDGALAYLRRQFSTIIVFLVILALLIYVGLSPGTAVAFVFGAVCSALVGSLGMAVALKANVRTAQAATRGMQRALSLAFNAGSVTGMLLVGLGLLGVALIFYYSYASFIGQGPQAVVASASEILVGFGFGATLIALFMRVGGGIYTKAADVGADLVGKLEKGIPEDDPRNPAVIADNVGDNVGDCAGMAADVFESYAITIVAAMLLGGIALGLDGIAFPLLIYSAAVLSSILATFFVRPKSDREHPWLAMQRGFYAASLISAVLFVALSLFFLNDFRPALAAIVGMAATLVIARLTDYYTSYRQKPVIELARAATTGAATNLLHGLALGMESAFVTTLAVAAAILAGFLILGYYGIALVGLGVLSLTGFIMSMDTFGPIADNAGGIVEMAKVKGRALRVMAPLDAVGNTTKALTKGFAISAAAVAAVALFSTFFEKTGLQNIDIASPGVFVGLLLGGALPFLFSAILIRAVGRAAFQMVEEVRRQFRTIPGLLQGRAKPDYARCVDISTSAAIRELTMPAIAILAAPLMVGFLLGAQPLGAFLGGAILSALFLALFSCNAGAAWDNAKKFIEAGNLGGKGTPTHAAAVVGDTVGDPLKDTSGPALNPMMKLLNIVSLLTAAYVVAWSLKLV
ncbi:MAG: sodium-translocating pyrophosphatase [Candidatus Micrarchaeia archaeon]